MHVNHPLTSSQVSNKMASSPYPPNRIPFPPKDKAREAKRSKKDNERENSHRQPLHVHANVHETNKMQMQRGHAVVTALAHPQRTPSQSRAQCAWLTRAFRRRAILGWALLFMALIRCALFLPNTTVL